MRIAYLDCFAGISGDMFLGALLDAGLDPQLLHDAVAALDLGATLEIAKVDRSGLTSTKVHVLEHGHLAEAQAHSHQPHEHKPKPEHPHEPDHQHTHERHHHPDTQHLHKTGHKHDHHEHEPHEHEHPHVHGRSLTAIRDLLQASSLAEAVKNFAIHTFELLGHAEAKIHNVPVDEIHFHEVGAVDAVVDITCAAAGVHALNQQAVTETGKPLRWHASALNVGGGTVLCAHGNFPVPAPATADLLRGMPTYSAHLEKELITPTGAALLRALDPTFGPQPAMRIAEIGYGAGTRNPVGFPNVLRLSLGEAVELAAAPTPETSSAPSAGSSTEPAETPMDIIAALPQHHPAQTDTVTVLETALDDLSPQILAHVTEQALALGALDVMSTAVTMKKGRLGTLLTLLTDDAHSPALERLLLRETSTLGIRIRTDRRICLAREHHTVQTPFGPIRIKVGSFDTEELNAAPEFEDCRAAAAHGNVAVKHVMQTATAAWLATKPQPAAPPTPETGH